MEIEQLAMDMTATMLQEGTPDVFQDLGVAGKKTPPHFIHTSYSLVVQFTGSKQQVLRMRFNAKSFKPRARATSGTWLIWRHISVFVYIDIPSCPLKKSRYRRIKNSNIIKFCRRLLCLGMEKQTESL